MFAYHSTADPAIAEYVAAGTLPDDSGPDVLVLADAQAVRTRLRLVFATAAHAATKHDDKAMLP